MKIRSYTRPELPITTIPLDHPDVVRGLALIQPQFHAETWIAGSAATRFGMHKDVDFWICHPTPTYAAAQLLTVPHQPRQAPQSALDVAEDYTVFCEKIYDHDNIQIMSVETDIHDMLRQFDITCHIGAVNVLTGEFVKGDGYSPILNIHHVGSAPSTLRRLYRFGERYNDWDWQGNSAVHQIVARTYRLQTMADLERHAKDLAMDRGL